MAIRASGGRLSAETILQSSSEHEAVNLDEPSPPFETSLTTTNESRPRDQPKRFVWWKRHIYISVPHDDCRDHFANERTALGYFRTAQAFAMLGVVIAQLMRLQRSENPDPILGFFVISVPLSCICHIMAFLVTCCGCYRFFEWQSNMARGRAISSGWVIVCVFTLSLLILVSMFALTTTIIIRRS